MSLKDRLAVHGEGLTPSERRVATVLLSNPQEALFLSAAEVATRSSVHESSVIRLAQKLGYKGYAALRDDLRHDSNGRSPSARAKLREQQSHELLKLAHDEAAAIMRMADMVDQAQIDDVARTLADARRTYIYGSSILVDCLQKRLRRVGLDSVAVPAYGRDVPDVASTITADDALFCFVLREPYAPMAPLMQVAQNVGARIAVLADEPGLQLTPRPDHLITALRGADDNFRTMIVPLVLCYAIELAIYHLEEERASEALDRLTSLSAVFNHPDRQFDSISGATE